MQIYSKISILLILFILFWLLYSIVVIVYLNALTRRYLTPKTKEFDNTKLKTYQDLLSEYADCQAINVLVLSGGGMRGMVPLHILSYIELKTGKKAGELFDFIAGSSTGAISAAGLVIGNDKNEYKFSATDILNKYWENSKKIFSSPWYHQLLTLFGLFAPRFLPDNKLNVLRYYYANLNLSDIKGNLLVPVYNIDQNKLQIIKNWTSNKDIETNNYSLADLINGASSPPTLFPPVAFELNKKNHLFIDPAILLNNPVLPVLLQLRTLFPKHKLNIVLIGNGGTSSAKYNYRNLFAFGLYGLYQYLFSAPSLSSKLYMEFIEDYLIDTERYDKNINFLRINSVLDEDIGTINTTEANLHKIKKFSNKMLEENMLTIEKIINLLLKSKNYSTNDAKQL